MASSQFSLRPVSATRLACKICGNGAPLYGVVDMHRPCQIEGAFAPPPLSGVPIYYRRCGHCGFLFTDAFDDWSRDDFKMHMYNDLYFAFDLHHAVSQSSENAATVAKLWARHKTDMRVLDFGGRNNVLCAALRASGFQEAVTYDPNVPEHTGRPDGKFDLVTCFETLEHLPDPLESIERIIECVAEPGAILYSTLTQPADFHKYGVSWWYVGPRNGHISIFTRESLSVAWGRYGYTSLSFDDNLHIAFRSLPEQWAMATPRA
jgi:2-polyprenyl-6-hydroxyphenyl methylase/3-demethylubiquinone-9 3-methyltransferase